MMIVDGSRPPKTTYARRTRSEASTHPAGLTQRPSHEPHSPANGVPGEIYTIWVGNVHSGTDILTLRDFIVEEGFVELESIYFIVKSNCAFVNFTTYAACVSATKRCGDMKFYGTYLKCRWPMCHARMFSHLVNGGSQPKIHNSPGKASYGHQQSGPTSNVAALPRRSSEASNRFFILKSFTTDSLELSTTTSTWNTRAQNEGKLLEAFKTSQNVYLVFSANKSGEFFGYARLTTPAIVSQCEVDSHEDPTVDYWPQLHVSETAASLKAPAGTLIHNPDRKTFFWIAQQPQKEAQDLYRKHTLRINHESPERPFGGMMQLRWLSTRRVPFLRAHGLRNQWNSDRAVKIARDGTEVEPSVGWQLINLFHSP